MQHIKKGRFQMNHPKNRKLHFLRAVLLIGMTLLSMSATMYADATYSFSGHSGNGNSTFSFTVPIVTPDNTDIIEYGSSMTTCNTGNATYAYCEDAVFFGADANTNGTDYDQLSFFACTDASCNSFLRTDYFFDDGAFNAVGTFTTNATATASFDEVFGLVRSSGTLTITSSTVPEPSSLLLLGSGALAFLGLTRRKLCA